MNREEAIKDWIIPAISRTWNDGRCKEILEALEQEPCTVTEFADRCMECGKILGDMIRDAVSRKEVMNMLHNHAFDYATSTKISSLLKTMRGEVDRMPSVTPAEKVGHWREVYAETDYRNGWIEFTCENCEYQHGLESGQYEWSYGDPIPWKYCPICGAKMQEVEE